MDTGPCEDLSRESPFAHEPTLSPWLLVIGKQGTAAFTNECCRGARAILTMGWGMKRSGLCVTPTKASLHNITGCGARVILCLGSIH